MLSRRPLVKALLESRPDNLLAVSSLGSSTWDLTAAGEDALRDYMTSSVRPGVSDMNKLVVALKLRFIEVLDADAQRDQLEQLRAMYEGELARLRDLAGHDEWQSGRLDAWIEMEIDQVGGRIAWCDRLLAAL